MSHDPKLLIAAHPTRGVDVGAQAQIWGQIRAAQHEGLAVLLISADLDELIGLSDNIRVIYRGRLVADADPATVTAEDLGTAMTGAAKGHIESDAEALAEAHAVAAAGTEDETTADEAAEGDTAADTPAEPTDTADDPQAGE